MKKLFNNRAFLSLLAFLTVCFMLIVLFFSGINTFATGDVNLVTEYDISSDYLENYDSYDCFLDLNGDTNIKDSFDLNWNNGFTMSDTFYQSYFNSYVITANSNNYSLYFYAYTDNSFICYDGTYIVIYSLLSECDYVQDNLSGRTFNCTFYADGSTYPDTAWYMNNGNLDNEWIIDGESYCRTSISKPIVSSNLPIYSCSDARNVTSVQGLPQINRNLDNNNLDPDLNFAPAFMYVNCDSYYKGEGLVTCLGMNDYQRDHADEYEARWSYTLNIDTGSNYPLIPNNSLQFSGNWRCGLEYFKNGSVSLSMIEIFSMMTSGGNSAWELIQTLPPATSKNKTATAGVDADFDVGVGDFTLNYEGAMNPTLHPYGILNTFFFTATCEVFRGGDACGRIVCTYDFLNGEYSSTNTYKNQNDVNNDINKHNYDNGLNDGDEGYLSLPDYQYSLPASNNNNYPAVNGGGTVSQGGSSYATGGSPSVNVNTGGVVVNTGTDGKAVVDYTTGQLLPSGDSVGFVDNLEDATEGSKFIELMADTFTFVPDTVWNDLGFYFEIFLGILVSFFVLRLILDIL